jgi:hypothetical protein
VAEPRVEFLWWDQCPSWERALEDLREAMGEAGLDPEHVRLRRIDSEDQASAESFPGSPTIRVEGEDVEPQGDGEQAGLVCRVYRRADGRASPLPNPDNVRAALARAAAGHE